MMKKANAIAVYSVFLVYLFCLFFSTWKGVLVSGWVLIPLLLLNTQPWKIKKMDSLQGVAHVWMATVTLVGVMLFVGRKAWPEVPSIIAASVYFSAAFLIWLVPCQIVRAKEGYFTFLNGLVKRPGTYIHIWPHDTRSLWVRKIDQRPVSRDGRGNVIIDTEYDEH